MYLRPNGNIETTGLGVCRGRKRLGPGIKIPYDPQAPGSQRCGPHPFAQGMLGEVTAIRGNNYGKKT